MVNMPVTENEQTEFKQTKKRCRIWELDFLRFIALLLMFAVHFFVAATLAAEITGTTIYSPFYDFAELCAAFIVSPGGRALQIACGALFGFISGITDSFGKPVKTLDKGLKLFVIAMCVTLFTSIFGLFTRTDTAIFFGILHMLGVSALIAAGIKALLLRLKANRFIAALCFAALGIALLVTGFVTDLGKIEIPYDFLCPFGVYSSGFYSADFYPLLPWAGFVFLGTAAGFLLYSKKRSLLPALDKKWNRPFCFLGRHTLIIYLTHQLIFTATFCAVFLCFPGL